MNGRKNMDRVDIKNYLRVKGHIPFTHKYVFLDTENHYFENIFRNMNLKAHIVRESKKNDAPYRLIICHISRNDDTLLEKAMVKVRNSALIGGYKQYDEMSELMQKVRVMLE